METLSYLIDLMYHYEVVQPNPKLHDLFRHLFDFICAHFAVDCSAETIAHQAWDHWLYT